MRQIRILVGRNVTLFLKNKTNIFLSFFSIIIVIGLYVIFLRDFILQSVKDSGLQAQYVKEFTDRLMVSGLMIVLNTTTCFGIMQLSVADAAKGVQRDFLVAPISSFQLEVGYWISSIIVSFFFTVLTLIGSEVYFVSVYESQVSGIMLGKAIGMVFFCSTIHSGMLLCLIRFMKDTTSFSTFGNLYGMMCGFLAGTYLPYAMYPEKLRNLLFYFPPMQLTSIIRQIYLSVYQKDGKRIGEELYQAYGVHLIKEQRIISMQEQWSYLIMALAVILLLVRIEYGDSKRRF
ncbi:ABC transporter, permease protein [Lachnospiraceae bacterium KM106-2]|nr:ABC transporter, permease protein [Lachnospiraceae bacterium KM106-2]